MKEQQWGSGGDCGRGFNNSDISHELVLQSLACLRGLKGALGGSSVCATEWGEKGGSLWGPEGEEERTTSNYHECNTQGEQIQRPSPNQVDKTPYLAVETSLELGKCCTSSSAKAWCRLLPPCHTACHTSDR